MLLYLEKCNAKILIVGEASKTSNIATDYSDINELAEEDDSRTSSVRIKTGGLIRIVCAQTCSKICTVAFCYILTLKYFCHLLLLEIYHSNSVMLLFETTYC